MRNCTLGCLPTPKFGEENNLPLFKNVQVAGMTWKQGTAQAGSKMAL